MRLAAFHRLRFGIRLGSLLLILFLSTSREAFARAGGGESFGGGGGGGGFSGGGGGFSGGGGYSGGGGGYRIGGSDGKLGPEDYIIFAVIAGFILFTILQGSREERVARTIRRGRQRQADRLREAALSLIRERDPRFSLERLQERVKEACLRIQDAWSRQDLSSVRPFISDGIHERFTLQIAMQQARGIRNVMEDVLVAGIECVVVSADAQFDTIHLRISATATDYNAELDSGRKVPGTEHSGPFVEVWSFHRRPSAKSLERDGAVEGNCPRCGAALQVVDVAHCDSCGSQVNSGEFDWVLAEITQESEWQVPEEPDRTPGLVELQQRDSGFSAQHIEDRVSVMFWKLRSAEFHRDAERSAGVVTPKYLAEIAPECSSALYWKDPAVGQVAIMDAASMSADGVDRLQVKVRWSGTLMERDGSRERRVRDQSIYTQTYTLIRNSNVKSPPGGMFTSAGCPACGAPVEVNREGKCRHCGAGIATGEFDWVLENVERFSSRAAFPESSFESSAALIAGERITRKTAQAAGDVQLSLAVLAKVMLLDGALDASERQALAGLAAHRGLSAQETEELVRQAGVAESEIPIPLDQHQAASFLKDLLVAVLADGRISRKEQSLLNRFAERSGLTPSDVRLALNREQGRLYRQAQAELRSSRRN